MNTVLKPQLGLIINPNSKINKDNPNLKQLLRQLVHGAGGQSFTTKSVDDLYDVAQIYKSERIKFYTTHQAHRCLVAYYNVFSTKQFRR